MFSATTAPPSALGENLVDIPHELEVEIQIQVLAGTGGCSRLALEGPDHAPDGIYLDVPNSLRSLEGLLILPLQPVLPDDHSLLISRKGRHLEFVAGDLSDVSHDMSQCWPAHVPALGPHFQEYVGELGPELFECCHLAVFRVLDHQKGLSSVGPRLF